MGYLSIGNSQSVHRNTRENLHRVATLAALLLWLICFSGSLTAQKNPEKTACLGETCPAYCKGLTVPKTSLGQCIAQCKASCQPQPPPPPPPVTVTPKFLVMAVAYAPPGCTTGPSGSPSPCGTQNGSSFVDYNSSSANGTKITTKDSFQLGLTISYDHSFLSGLHGGGSYGFQETDSDTTAVSVTKTRTSDWKVQGNGDGVDHGQDQFFLLLHPKVILEKRGSEILWSVTDGGAPYTVYASELRNPSSARASTTQVLQEDGLTTADFQSILDTDPYGGKVVAGGHGLLSTVEANVGTLTAKLPGTGPPAPGAGLDPSRFWYTGLSFPYEPALTSAECNGGICNCDAYSGSLTNDNLSDTTHSEEGQTTVDLEGGVKVPEVYELKIDSKMVWTSSSTTDNSTENKQTATATVTCPSTNYTGPFGIQVWWDSRYGSFVLIPYDPGAVALIHRGQVVNATGKPVRGQLVSMVYGGKTQRTYTARDGSYGFPAWSGAPKFTGKAQIETGNSKQTVDLGVISPIVIKVE